MARLPEPGKDAGIWGDVLNQYLLVAHNENGTIKEKGQPNGLAELDVTGKVPVSQLPSSVVVSDATTTDKGILQLAGDLTGTATSPQIASGVIDNANISASAGIAQTKITNLTSDLAAKEPTITAGTTAQYWRGDKSWQTLDKAAVALGNVDNTSDLNKPISTATQAVIDALVYSKTITIESPTNSENITLFHTDMAITITKLHAVLRGSSPSITFQLSHGSDRSDAGTALFGSNQTLTGASSTTTGTEYTSFSDATLLADEILWATTSASSGVVDEMALTIYYTVD